MRNTLSKIVIFAAGAAIGSAATWYFTRKRYERISREEIDSVRDMYDRLEREIHKGDSEEIEPEDEEENIDYYDKILASSRYGRVEHQKDNIDVNIEEEEEDEVIEIEVIDPDDYGNDDYPTESLNYYEGDGVLTDSFDNVIEYTEEFVGKDFASHFGCYGNRDKDTVYIRNHKMRLDFEILRDYGRFSEVD